MKTTNSKRPLIALFIAWPAILLAMDLVNIMVSEKQTLDGSVGKMVFRLATILLFLLLSLPYWAGGWDAGRKLITAAGLLIFMIYLSALLKSTVSDDLPLKGDYREIGVLFGLEIDFIRALPFKFFGKALLGAWGLAVFYFGLKAGYEGGDAEAAAPELAAK
jgi:hypothetical protein